MRSPFTRGLKLPMACGTRTSRSGDVAPTNLTLRFTDSEGQKLSRYYHLYAVRSFAGGVGGYL